MRFILQSTKHSPKLKIDYIQTLEKLNIKYEIVHPIKWEGLFNDHAVGCIIEINTLEQLNQFSDNVPWSLIYNDMYDTSLFPKDKYPNIKAIEIYDYYKE